MTPVSFGRQDSDSAQYRLLRNVHEGFARQLADALSAFLQSELKAELEGAKFVSAADFRLTLSSPSCLITLQLEPRAESAVLVFDSSTAFHLLELLLGGKSSPSQAEPRKLTEIEWSLLEELVRVLAAALGEAWKTYHAVEFKVQSLESDPTFLPAVSPTLRLVELAFTIHFGEEQGHFRVAVPQTFFEIDLGPMEAEASEPNARDVERNAALLEDAGVDVELLLDGPTIHFQEVAALSPGQVVRFDFPLQKPLRALVNGTVPIPCLLVNSGRRRAFQVEGHP